MEVDYWETCFKFLFNYFYIHSSKIEMPVSKCINILFLKCHLVTPKFFCKWTPVSQMEVGCSRIWGLKPTTQTQVSGTPHKPAYPQPCHEPLPPPQTPNQAPVTLNSEFNRKLLRRGPYWGGEILGSTRAPSHRTLSQAKPWGHAKELLTARTAEDALERQVNFHYCPDYFYGFLLWMLYSFKVRKSGPFLAHERQYWRVGLIYFVMSSQCFIHMQDKIDIYSFLFQFVMFQFKFRLWALNTQLAPSANTSAVLVEGPCTSSEPHPLSGIPPTIQSLLPAGVSPTQGLSPSFALQFSPFRPPSGIIPH